MQITLSYTDGSSITLPPEFALDDWNVSTQRASVRLPGRVGPVPAGRAYAKPRQLRLSATYEGLSQSDAEQLDRTYRSYLVGRGPIKLKRYSEADRYIVVRCTRVASDPHRGHFGGRVATLSYDLEAADPFWYATALEQHVRQCAAVYDCWTITNPGGLRFQQAKVTFTARTNGVINPSLHNGNGGALVRYTGTLNAGQSVVLDGDTRTAIIGASNVLPSVNGAWQADGFWLMPGDNPLTYQDDAASSHACTCTIEWRPAWW